MMKNRRSFIIGLKSKSLLIKEKKFLLKYKPWGVILFSRNIKNVVQARKLTNDIRSVFKDKKYPILIDEEGGRVSRLKKIINNNPFTGSFFGKLYIKDKKKFITYYKIFEIGGNEKDLPLVNQKVANSIKSLLLNKKYLQVDFKK